MERLRVKNLSKTATSALAHRFGSADALMPSFSYAMNQS